MKKIGVKTVSYINVLIVCVLLLSSVSHAASPRQNTEEVVKALHKMQQSLSVQNKPLNTGSNRYVKTIKNRPAEKDNAVESSLARSKNRKLLKTPPGDKKIPYSSIITSISLKGNELDISYKGKLSYNVLQEVKEKIVAIDIISPALLPPQFSTGMAIRLKPSSEGNIKYAVTYLHKNDNLAVLYHKPFLRISVLLRKFTKYKVERLKNMLRLTVLLKKPSIPDTKKEKVPADKKVNKSNSVKIPYISKSEAKSLPISLKSISRIVSPYSVKQVIYSREQRIQIQVDGSNIYIKPLPTKLLMPDGSFMLRYSTDPKDIYILTSRKVYSIHLIPKNIPSVTYKLKPVESSGKAMQYANKLFLSSMHGGKASRPAENDYISGIVYLLRAVYTGNMPPDYTLLPLKSGFTVKGKYIVSGEYEIGTLNGSVDVYKVTALENENIDERDFVPFLGGVSAVMALDRYELKGESTYLYAVYTGGDHEE